MDYIKARLKEIAMDYIKARLKETSTIRGLVLFLAYIVMYFTPDNIDSIIRSALLSFGVINVVFPDKIGG